MSENQEQFSDKELDNNDLDMQSSINNDEGAEHVGQGIEEKLAEEKDRYIRLFAEFENFKKRTQKEKMEFYQYASQDLIVSMLNVLDDFERAIKEMEKSEHTEQLEGIKLIYNKFKNTLIEKGLTPVEVSVGDAFNVDFHEAVTQIPAPSPELKGKVVDILETGYRLHDRVIRFAKVVIGA